MKWANAFPIFGPDESLGETLNNHPLAICVGYDQTLQSDTRRLLDRDVRKERNDPSNILKILSELDFKVIYTEKAKDAGAIIAGNMSFQELLPND